MRRSISVLCSSVIIASGFVFAHQAPASADDATIRGSVPLAGTVDMAYVDGQIEKSQPLWTGDVPVKVRLPRPSSAYSSSCYEFAFPIQATLPAEDMKDVDVNFEIWTKDGTEVASASIWGYSEWNPADGPTQVEFLTCSDDFKKGSYNFFITTEYELSTDGLLSRYVEGKQTLNFRVQQKRYVICEKGFRDKVFSKKKCPKGWKKVRN